MNLNQMEMTVCGHVLLPHRDRIEALEKIIEKEEKKA